MSWDVSVFAAKEVPPPVEEMPSNWRGDSLGSQQEVRDKINACLPGIDWSDPSWGILEGNGYSFEFNVCREEPNESFMIHVRGGGDAIAALDRLVAHTGWFLLDSSQGEWLHHCADREAGWSGFQKYRDRVLGDEAP